MPRKKNQSREGKNRPTKKGGAKQPKAEITGKVMMTREGYAFIATEVVNSDIFIPARKLRGALHGDLVRVVYSDRKTGGSRREGEVIEIVERSKRPYIGVLQIVGDQAWVITEGKNMPYDIRVEIQESDKVHNGFKVAAMVDDWPRRSDEPIGHLIDVLGMPGDNNTEMHAILTEFGLPYKFDPKVEREAEQIPDEITAQDIKERRDFRGVTTFTIDPTDAKDFDDALSLKELSPGNWEVGVHIADVTHYVRPGTTLDKEALDRGTSVYLVDRTVPMLPEKLSNRLCSLRPREEKLCFSAVFEMDEKSRVHKRWFGRTIIKSDYRFDYEQAQDIIETQKGPLVNEMLKLHQLAKQLREERFRKGAISFERPEMKVEVDKDGKPTNIIQKISKDSNWLIEEFMLLANREVATLIGGKEAGAKAKTFVYRIHEEPNIDKIEAFRSFISHLGYTMRPTKNPRELSSEINNLLATAKGKPEEGSIEIMALRSMARARYSTDNFGHYGLAFDYYTHFTSPIRRYPDMMVHRMLAHYLDKGKSLDKQSYEDKCKHSSEREQLATEAERASIKYKMVEFMQDKVGNIYDGNISGITEWGMFVEIADTKVEGLVSLRDIKEDYFAFDEESFSLTGRRSGKKFVLGYPVKIKVIKANLEQKQLDYALMWDDSWNNENPQPQNERYEQTDRSSRKRTGSFSRGGRGSRKSKS
ncbi:MAG TPA: ribonuclease R [Rikenellaceae bacterium]|nr:MAG: ribonuclease R [Bacteroidetes bacterium GWE2_40_15]HBZ24608.1 ribonuclease R [Rikenellaceae bacterium]